MIDSVIRVGMLIVILACGTGGPLVNTAFAQWVFSLGAGFKASSSAGYSSLAVDANSTAYVAGAFGGTVSFDLQYQPDTLKSRGSANTIVARYRADGYREWTTVFESMGPSDSNKANVIRLDSAGSFYVAGTFIGAMDCDPDEGEALLTAHNTEAVYVAKYDTSGTYRWATQIDFRAGFVEPIQMAVDSESNVYVAGEFAGQAVLQTGGVPLVVEHDGACFGLLVAKYDARGILQWAFPISTQHCSIIGDMTLDESGNLYLTGGLGGAADFDPGPGQAIISSSGTPTDVFVARYDAAGRLLRAFSFGGNEGINPFDSGHAIAVDDSMNVYVGGRFSNSIDFDPGPDEVTHYNPHSVGDDYDAFIAKYDSTGGFLWGQTFEDEGDYGATDNVHAISITSGGGVTVIGNSGGIVEFGEDPARLSGLGFVASYSSDGVFTQAFRIGGTIRDGHELDGGAVYLAGHFEGGADFHPDPDKEAKLYSASRSAFVSRYLQGNISGPILVDVERLREVVGGRGREIELSAYPTPTTDVVTLRIVIPQGADVRVDLFDVLGRRMGSVYDGFVPPGSGMMLQINTGPMANGTYLVLVQSNQGVRSLAFQVAK